MRLWKVRTVFLVVTPLIVALGYLAIPARPGSHTRAYLGIVATLRQIDGAKEQYAIDHKTPLGTVVMREELLIYIPEKHWYPHADYHINPLGVFPEAVLPARFSSLPAKTIIRLQTNNPGYHIILPDRSM
jgi:hypothetical protein